MSLPTQSGTPTGDTTGVGTALTLTWTHTYVAGTDGVAYVWTGINNQTGTSTVSGVTFDGVAMTQISALVANNRELALWRLFNPPATVGASIVATVTVATRIDGASLSYNGVHQTLESTVVTDSSSSASSLTLLVTTDEELSIGSLLKNNSTESPADAGATQTHLLLEVTSSGTANNDIQLDVDSLGTDTDPDAVSTAIAWTWSANRPCMAMAFPLTGSAPVVGTAPTSTLPYLPYGISVLGKGGVAISSSILADLDIHGISVRVSWKKIQPTSASTYDWSFVDSELARVIAAGKYATLRVITGSTGVPSWALSGVDTFTAAAGFTCVKFWDETWMARKMTLFKAIAERYDGYAGLRAISTPLFNGRTDDWNIPNDPSDVTAWTAFGYTTDRMIEAGKLWLRQMFAWFRRTPCLLFAVAANSVLDSPQSVLANTLADWAYHRYAPRIVFTRNALAATSANRASSLGSTFETMGLYADYGVAFQMAVPADTAAHLAAAIAKGNTYPGIYQEIYRGDVNNPAFRTSWAGGVSTTVSTSPGLVFAPQAQGGGGHLGVAGPRGGQLGPNVPAIGPVKAVGGVGPVQPR